MRTTASWPACTSTSSTALKASHSRDTFLAARFRRIAVRRGPLGVGSLRHIIVAPTPIFGPLVVNAGLLKDGTVELMNVVDHPEYWEMTAGDLHT